jgi:hypothetical protein
MLGESMVGGKLRPSDIAGGPQCAVLAIPMKDNDAHDLIPLVEPSQLFELGEFCKKRLFSCC